jgi:hypothetical protein
VITEPTRGRYTDGELLKKGQLLCFVAIVVLTACGQATGSAAAKQSPTPAVSARVSADPSPSADPPPSPSPSPGAFNLTCRLPVIDNSGVGTNRGWTTFPGGTFTRDSSRQSNGIYDWATHAWLPQYAQAAPDGLTYVIQGPETSKGPGPVSLVNAKTGSSKVILSARGPTASEEWLVLSYESGGVFLGALKTLGVEIPSLVPGLWLLDPRTGRVRLVDRNHNWALFGAGFAWRLDDPEVIGGTLTNIYRLDLATLQTTAWYQSKTSMGMESPTSDGDLLVWYADWSQLALLGSAHRFTPVVLPSEIDLANNVFAWSVARPGVWIPEDTGLALYVKGVGVQVMAPNPNPLDPDSKYLYVAGDCR